MKKSLNLLADYSFQKITAIRPDFFSGAQLIIFDLDNTLVFPETTQTLKEITDWFSSINRAYKCVIISNSYTFKERAPKISQIFNCPVFLSSQKKPFKKLFQELKDKYNFENDKVFVIGDRIFTDILFGNINKSKTVLVAPLSGNESLLIKIVRIFEKSVLFLMEAVYNK